MPPQAQDGSPLGLPAPDRVPTLHPFPSPTPNPAQTGEEEELALHLINDSTSQSMSQALSPSWAREQGTRRPHPGGQWALKASCVRVGLGSMDGWAQGEWRIPHLGTG